MFRVKKPLFPYIDLMKKFTAARLATTQCKAKPLYRPLPKQFPTGSRYEGDWDSFGMSGVGTYIFTTGTIYEGELEDGKFHGTGELLFPGGEVLKCKFRRHRVVERRLIFNDGLEYCDAEWLYCRSLDRRYTLEYEVGIPPPDKSFMTADLPSKKIPPGCYDVGDGFYDPKSGTVYEDYDLTLLVRSVTQAEGDWITTNCRTEPIAEIGPLNSFYEVWLDPEVVPGPMPLPAAVSRATAYLFASHTSMDSVYDDEDDWKFSWEYNVMEYPSFDIAHH